MLAVITILLSSFCVNAVETDTPVNDEIIDEYIIPLTDGREAVSLFEKHRQDK